MKWAAKSQKRDRTHTKQYLVIIIIAISIALFISVWMIAHYINFLVSDILAVALSRRISQLDGYAFRIWWFFLSFLHYIFSYCIILNHNPNELQVNVLRKKQSQGKCYIYIFTSISQSVIWLWEDWNGHHLATFFICLGVGAFPNILLSQPHSVSEKTNLLQKKNIHVSVVSLLLPFVLDLHFICIEFTLLGVSNFTRQIQAWACHLHSMCLPPFCLIQNNIQQCVKAYISRLARGKKNQNHLVSFISF